MIEIERNAFVCCFGVTRTGKSLAARQIFMAQAWPRVAIDVKDEMDDRLPGIPIVHEPAQILEYPTCRAVPLEPSDEDWYDELYATALAASSKERGGFYLWLDEGNEATSRSFIPRGARRFILQGLGRQCGHIVCSPRPVDVHVTFEGQATHFFFFEMQHDRDRLAVASLTGIAQRDVDAAFDEIASHRVSDVEPSHHYAYFRRGMRELRVCAPLDDPEILTAQIATRSYPSWAELGYESWASPKR